MHSYGHHFGAGGLILVAAFLACDGDDPSSPKVCTEASDCNDNDPCTDDVCNTAENRCENPKNDNPGCGPCTSANQCDDEDPCTLDKCEANGDGTATCQHTPSCTGGGDPGGGGQGGGGVGCNMNGMCETPTESCDCADCQTLEICGAGCMEFTIVDAPSANFLDATPSNLGGPAADYFQGFGLTAPGVYALSPPANLATDCMGPTPCIQLNVDGMNFLAATSGTLNLTSTAPIEAVFTDVVFHPYTVDMNNNVTVDLDGPCLYLEEGIVPTM